MVNSAHTVVPYMAHGSRVGIRIARWFLVRYGIFALVWYIRVGFQAASAFRPSESQLMVTFRYDVDSELIDRWLNQSGRCPLRWWFGLMPNILSQQARAQGYQKVTCKLKMKSPMFWYRSFTITHVSKAQKACFMLWKLARRDTWFMIMISVSNVILHSKVFNYQMVIRLNYIPLYSQYTPCCWLDSTQPR